MRQHLVFLMIIMTVLLSNILFSVAFADKESGHDMETIIRLTNEFLEEKGWSGCEKIIGPVFAIGAGKDDNVFVSYYFSAQEILIRVTVEECTHEVDGDSLVCRPERPYHIRTFFNKDSASAIARCSVPRGTKLYRPTLCFAGKHSSEVALEYDGPFWRFWDQDGNEYYMYTNLNLIPSRVAARKHFDLIDWIHSARKKQPSRSGSQ